MAKPKYVFSKPWAYGRPEKEAPYPPQKQNMPGSGRTSIEMGFPDETMLPPAYGGLPPYGQDFNGVFKAITENLSWYSAGGIFEYDANRDYDPPAIVSYLGKIYRCVAPNMAFDPSTPGTDTACWLHIMDESDIKPIMSSFSGMVAWFASQTAPTEDWLIADGRAVSRTIYKGLFNVLGTLYGDGDGKTTFNLPDLIDRVAWGATSSSVGGYLEAGLPNLVGRTYTNMMMKDTFVYEEDGSVFYQGDTRSAERSKSGGGVTGSYLGFDASRSSSIYGNSETVQPPAVKLLPCIHV